MLVRCDDDDPCLPQYQRIDYPANCLFKVGPQVKMAGAMEEAFISHYDESFFGFMGDDTIPRTANWDVELQKSAGDWLISYPDDLLSKDPTHPFIGGELVRAVGFWALPGLTHLYTDTVWGYLGKLYGNLVHRPDVILEHMHFSVGKSAFDSTYERCIHGVPYAARDKERFEQWANHYTVSSTIAASVKAQLEKSLTSEARA